PGAAGGEILRVERRLRHGGLARNLARERVFRRPEPAAIGPHHAAGAVDDDDRADPAAAVDLQRGAAEPALEDAGLGPKPGAPVAEPEILARAFGGKPAEAAVRRRAGPVAASRESEVEDDRGRD